MGFSIMIIPYLVQKKNMFFKKLKTLANDETDFLRTLMIKKINRHNSPVNFTLRFAATIQEKKTSRPGAICCISRFRLEFRSEFLSAIN